MNVVSNNTHSFVLSIAVGYLTNCARFLGVLSHQAAFPKYAVGSVQMTSCSAVASLIRMVSLLNATIGVSFILTSK